MLRTHWPLAASLLLGVLVGWMLFHPRQAAVHEKVDEHTSSTATKNVDKDTARETDREAGPTRKVVLEFDPKCPPATPLRAGDPLPPSILRQTIIESGPVQTITRAATELHTAEQVQTTADRRLELTVTPPAQSGWALQLGVEDVLSRRAVRIEARRRIVGPLWAGLSVLPAQREVGLAVAVEW